MAMVRAHRTAIQSFAGRGVTMRSQLIENLIADLYNQSGAFETTTPVQAFPNVRFLLIE
jgi:hypothetical protein